jgi:hypothetical protein
MIMITLIAAAALAAQPAPANSSAQHEPMQMGDKHGQHGEMADMKDCCCKDMAHERHDRHGGHTRR